MSNVATRIVNWALLVLVFAMTITLTASLTSRTAYSSGIRAKNAVYAKHGFHELDLTDSDERTRAEADGGISLGLAESLFPSPAVNVYVVTSNTQAAVTAAMTTAGAGTGSSGQVGGIVETPPGTISVASPGILAVSGVSVVGPYMSITASGSSGTPDTAWNVVGGTQFVAAVSNTYPCFYANLTGTPPSVFNTIQIGHANFQNLSFNGFSDGIQIGSNQLCGASFCYVDDCYFVNCDWAWEFFNSIHCHFSHCFAVGCLNGYHFGDLAAHSGTMGLQNGNSDFTDLYHTNASMPGGMVGLQSRGILIDATNSGTSAIEGLIHLYHVQCNEYSKTEVTDTTGTSSSSGLTASSPTKVASLLPGMLIFIDTVSASTLTTGIEYVLQSVNYSTGLMTLGNTLSGSAVTMSASSANVAWHTYGFAMITIQGGALGESASRIASVDILGPDTEGSGVGTYIENASTTDIFNVGKANTRDHDLVLRACQNSEFHCLSSVLTDVDSGSTTCQFFGAVTPTASQRTGLGMVSNPTSGSHEIWLNGTNADLQTKTDAGNWVYPNTGFGMRISGFSSGATLSGNSSGLSIYNSSSNGTATLATIVNSGLSSTWNLGQVHWVTVNGTGSLKLGTGGSQPYQYSGNTNLFCTITQGGALGVISVSTAGNNTGGTLYWVVVAATNCTFSAS